MDRTYIDQHLATLRADIITVMDAKFRAIQNNQERIIKLLEGGDEKPKKEETITEAYAWKLEMRRRVDKMVKNYPELYSDFNNVLHRVYLKMRDVYGFVSAQARDYRTGQAERWMNKKRSRNLNDQIAAGENQTEDGSGQLNPAWVEWLMGFPTGWTELNVSETQ